MLGASKRKASFNPWRRKWNIFKVFVSVKNVPWWCQIFHLANDSSLLKVNCFLLILFSVVSINCLRKLAKRIIIKGFSWGLFSTSSALLTSSKWEFVCNLFLTGYWKIILKRIWCNCIYRRIIIITFLNWLVGSVFMTKSFKHHHRNWKFENRKKILQFQCNKYSPKLFKKKKNTSNQLILFKSLVEISFLISISDFNYPFRLCRIPLLLILHSLPLFYSLDFLLPKKYPELLSTLNFDSELNCYFISNQDYYYSFSFFFCVVLSVVRCLIFFHFSLFRPYFKYHSYCYLRKLKILFIQLLNYKMSNNSYRKWQIR